MATKLHLISGLPRSGSTLLCALLRQNSRFSAAMTSPLAALFGAIQPKMSGSEFSAFFDGEKRADMLRGLFGRDLGFGRADRAESVRRAAEIARVALDSGLIVVASLVSPFREDRQRARDIVGAGRFVEVFVDASLETCMRRDPKGLYQRARAGLIPEFTGVSSPYENPVAPALHIASDHCSCSESVDILLTHLASRPIARHGIEAE